MQYSKEQPWFKVCYQSYLFEIIERLKQKAKSQKLKAMRIDRHHRLQAEALSFTL